MSTVPATLRGTSRKRWWYVRGTLKVMAIAFVIWFIVLPIIPGVQQASHDLGNARVGFALAGLGLQLLALLSYTLLTKAALPAPALPTARLFRIQLSTRSLSSIMPGGSAVGSALGYRLLTLSGVRPADAGFALATVGLGSAVVLNVLFFIGLFISIPIRGVNPVYGTAAAVGVALLMFVAGVVVGLLKGQQRAEGLVRAVAVKLRWDPDRAVDVIRHVADRLRDLLRDRRLLAKVAGLALANWLLDAAALWMFFRAFGGSLAIDGLLVSFCLANVLAAVPITPGGLGIVEGVLIPTVTAFGLTRSQASLGVLGYRLVQYWLPILIGALSYLSLRVGPWSIERRDRLDDLRQVAHDSIRDTTDSIEWAEEYAPRRVSQ
jgi:putative heme transporter